jgi:hypothetical protein
MTTFTITHNHEDGTRFGGSRKGDGAWEILQGVTRRWRSRPEIGVYLRGSRDRDADQILIRRTVAALEAAGHPVTVDVDNAHRTAAERRAALDERADARAGRLDASAGRAAAESDRRREAADAIADRRPFGQPDLVDHYSYAKTRRDGEKIHANTRASIDAANRAEQLADRADGTRANAAHRNDPAAIMRRIEKLAADVRRCERERDGYSRNFRNTSGEIYQTEEHPPASAGRAEDLARWIARDTEEIEHLRGELAAMDAAGRFSAWTPEHFERGDFARVGGDWYEVVRVNRKSVSVRGRFYGDGDRATPVTFDEIHGRRRDGLQWDAPNGQPWPVEQARRVARWRGLYRVAERADQHPYGSDERRSGRWVGMAVRLVHGLDTDATNQELSAVLESIDAGNGRDLAERYLAVYERLAAGALPHEIADSIDTEPGAPAWRFPTGVETVRVRAGRGWPHADGLRFVEPGDLIAGMRDRGFGASRDTLWRGFVGPVATVGETVNRHERGDFVTITLADGTDKTVKITEWFEVYPAGTWETAPATATVSVYAVLGDQDGELVRRETVTLDQDTDEAAQTLAEATAAAEPTTPGAAVRVLVGRDNEPHTYSTGYRPAPPPAGDADRIGDQADTFVSGWAELLETVGGAR